MEARGLLPVIAASLVATSVAHAQGTSTSQQLLAESLFDQGRVLMEQGKYPEACAKFAESQRLDPGGGTLMNLAVCHEKEGRLGTAYVELSAALAQATREGRKDREALAREHLAAITPKLPRLGVTVQQDEPDLEVLVDGAVLRRPAWGVASVVDPGTHVVEATAPGKVTFSVQIPVGAGEKRIVEIPPLRSGAGVPVVSAGLPPAPSSDEPPPRSSGSSTGRTVAAFAAGLGFTVAGIAASVWLPFTISRRASCEDERRFCSESGLDALAWEQRMFWTAAVSAAVGTAGLVTFLVLPSGTRVAATPTAGGGALSLGGVF